MKVAVQCESPLLQRSLELFLAGHLSSMKQCDVVLRDFRGGDAGKPALYISSDAGADIVKPFSRSQLMLAIEKRLKKEKSVSEIVQITEELDAFEETTAAQGVASEVETLARLEERIAQLTAEYQKNIIEAVRAFYGR